MFYSENDILSELKCPICKDIFDEPKLLECGYAICNQCILSHIETKQTKLTNEFKCLLCSEVHELPKNGFTVCKPLLKLLAKSSNTIYRGEHVESLITNIRYVENELKKLDFELNNGSDVIKDHCIELRRQIQLTTETRIQELEHNSNRLLKLIDNFESSVLTAYANSNRNRLTKRLNEYKTTCEESKNYLEKIELDLSILNDLNEKIGEIKSKLAMDKHEIRSFVFSNQIIQFIKSSDQQAWSQVGEIKIHSLDCVDLSKLKRTDLSACFRTNTEPKYFRWGAFANGNLVIALGTTTLKIFVYDKVEKFLKKFRRIEQFDGLNNMLVSSDKIVVQYRKSGDSGCLRVFDKNLDSLNQLDNFVYALVGINENFIYCGSTSVYRLNSVGDENRLIIYNHSLKLVKTIGQKDNPFEAFYFPGGIRHLCCENRRIYFMNNDYTLRIVDEMTGVLLGSVKLKMAQFYKIDANGNVITLEWAKNMCGEHTLKMKLITYRGEIYRRVNLVEFPLVSLRYFSFDRNDKLNFFNYEDLNVYFEES